MKDEHLTIQSLHPIQKGGQQVGTPTLGVTVIHNPSGLLVTCTAERSQYKNKRIACSMIEWGLAEIGWVD